MNRRECLTCTGGHDQHCAGPASFRGPQSEGLLHESCHFSDGSLLKEKRVSRSCGTLSERLDRVQRFSLDDALEMLVQIATGLEYLHQQGIVHRDLKPHNVLIALDGQAKISDFSTALWPEADLPYDIGQVGTFEYMSPEVLEAGVADHRSDVFALGIIAYQLVTGQLPYQSTQFADRLELNRRGKPTPAHRLCSDCPRTLSRLIAKAMKKKPTRRLQSAGEMLDALTALQKARGARHLW